MKDIEGQMSIFDMARLFAYKLDTKPEPPVLLESGQVIYIVKKGDVRKAKVLDENWICNDEDRGYRLQYDNGCYDSVWNSNLDRVVFHNLKDAQIKADKFLSEHDVIRSKDIHPLNTVAYQYIRDCDNRTMTAFYCELDNGMMYIKEFVTYHHIIIDKKRQRNAIKDFMEQNEIKNGKAVHIDYEPIFKNMYRIGQKYDWDYSEAEHSCSTG